MGDPPQISAACAAAHAEACATGAPGYLDPETGLFVMTADYLQDRGWCCGNGCRHCPWDGLGPRSAD